MIDSTKTRNNELWDEFCRDPKTLSDLQNEANQWLSSEANKTIYIKWGKGFKTIDEKKRLYYAAKYGTSASGVPWASCVIKDHKNDSVTSFDCKAARKELFEQYKASRSGATYTPAKKQSNSSKPIVETTENKVNRTREEERQTQLKANARAQADLAWDKANIDLNGSVYLKKKGLLPIGIEPFIRYYFHTVIGYLICAIVDIENKIHGYQKIADEKILINGEERDKKFIKGTETKGHFVPLGILDDTTRVVYIAEGVASGISVKQGVEYLEKQNPPSKNGKPKPQPIILCALFAGNISAVVEALNKKYPKLKRIYIASDNDLWKENEINEKTGLKKGNAGLIASNKAALKCKKVRIVKPNFAGLDTSKKPTDFNDLHQLAGLEEVARQLKRASKVDPRYAFFKEKQKESKRREQLFSRHSILNLNERYLPKSLAQQIVQNRTVILDSAIGTGKTELIKSILDTSPNETVLYISHLISLNGQASERLNLEFYGDIKGTKQNLWEVQKMSCCLNSLPMLIRKGKIRTSRIVIIDEDEQLLARLTTQIANKPVVLNCLEHLVRSAELLIVADAHISERTMHILEQWREGKFLCVNNTYEVGTGRKIIFHELPGSIQEDASKELLRKDGKGKVFIFSNNKRLARQSFDLLAPLAILNSKKTLYISGDNNNDPNVVAAFENPALLKDYGLVVCTPSVNTGLSIEDPDITFVAGMFSSKVNTACDAMQALGRVRNTKKIHCWIDERKNNLPTNKKQIIKKWTESFDYDLSLMGFSKEDTLTINNPVYEQLVVDVTKASNISKNNFLHHFLKLAAFDGYSIEYKELEERHKKTSREVQKAGKETEDREYKETRINEVTYTKEQADAVENLSRRTFSQTRALDKYKNLTFYNLPENATKEEVESIFDFDDRGKGKTKVLNLELALSTPEQLGKRYFEEQKKIQEIGSKERFTQDWRYFAVKREFFLTLLVAVGLTKELTTNNTIDEAGETIPYIYNKDSESITTFINWVLDRKGKLSGIINIADDERFEASLKKDPIRFISNQLQKIGLGQERVGDNAKGFYKIHDVLLGKIRTILVKRGNIEGLTDIKTLVSPKNPVFPLPINQTQSIASSDQTLVTIIYNNNSECLQNECLVKNECLPENENPLTTSAVELGETLTSYTDVVIPVVTNIRSIETPIELLNQPKEIVDKEQEFMNMKKTNKTVFSPIERDNLLKVLQTALDGSSLQQKNKAMYWKCKDLVEGFTDLKSEGIEPNQEVIESLRCTAKELKALTSPQLEAIEEVKSPKQSVVRTNIRTLVLHPDAVKQQISDYLFIAEKESSLSKAEIETARELIRNYLITKSHNYKGDFPEPYRRAVRALGEFYSKYQHLIDKDLSIQQDCVEIQVA